MLKPDTSLQKHALDLPLLYGKRLAFPWHLNWNLSTRKLTHLISSVTTAREQQTNVMHLSKYCPTYPHPGRDGAYMGV